jgi:hypothetical protein
MPMKTADAYHYLRENGPMGFTEFKELLSDDFKQIYPSLVKDKMVAYDHSKRIVYAL